MYHNPHHTHTSRLKFIKTLHCFVQTLGGTQSHSLSNIHPATLSTVSSSTPSGMGSEHGTARSELSEEPIIEPHSVEGSPTDWQWIVLDGPVDTIWVENLNTVLDDSKVLCLANGERISLTPGMRMLFEVDDLSQASPATISRCAMVYMVSTLK